ncbi:hypothetical protein NB693_22820 [Pantoea ananatis]|uniref:hypothetical protein n=1 Tax=Pantoea ananas TaxID=553 RepID=UPI00221EC4F4|nr:hypothetical protein [Pantoea ananatis]
MGDSAPVALAARLWRRLSLWLRRVPIADPLDRRNAPALQVLFVFLGSEIPLNKLYHLLTAPRIEMSTMQLAVDVGTDAAIAAGVPDVMLTLAALVIGRRALWLVYLCIPLIFSAHDALVTCRGSRWHEQIAFAAHRAQWQRAAGALLHFLPQPMQQRVQPVRIDLQPGIAAEHADQRIAPRACHRLCSTLRSDAVNGTACPSGANRHQPSSCSCPLAGALAMSSTISDSSQFPAGFQCARQRFSGRGGQGLRCCRPPL